ncbi:transposase, IS116/IS110/IS902 domain protein [Leptospira santarosai serovar Shermani str. 1342KT]|nr:transposase, IS116/IS110/IS902 domain protein [Leptospira santarosai serovar Shermani str. 1342KT]
MITSLAILSYMGDCKRFSSAKQAAYYVGLVHHDRLIFRVTLLITAEL